MKVNNLSDLEIFKTIVDAGGISAAALVMKSSPPAVSRRLSAIERRLGVRLAQRQSRRFSVTDEGTLFYERCCSILELLRDADAEVSSRGGAVRGILSVGTPTDFGRRYIAPMIARFTSQYPGLETHQVVSDAGLEVGVDCDVILQFGQPDDQNAISRKIASTDQLLCASPAYLAKYGRPETHRDLLKHNCMRLVRRHRVTDVWPLEKDSVNCHTKVSGTLSSASGEILRAWALSNEGISLEARWDVAQDLDAGRLVQILPDYSLPKLDLFAGFGPGAPVPPRIRIFVDFLSSMPRASSTI